MTRKEKKERMKERKKKGRKKEKKERKIKKGDMRFDKLHCIGKLDNDNNNSKNNVLFINYN